MSSDFQLAGKYVILFFFISSLIIIGILLLNDNYNSDIFKNSTNQTITYDPDKGSVVKFFNEYPVWGGFALISLTLVCIIGYVYFKKD